MALENLASIIIDGRTFMAGTSLNGYIGDAGISPDFKGQNLFKDAGAILYPQPAGTDLSTNLLDDPIAYCTDPTYLGNDCFIVDEGGNFYTLSGSTLTKRQTDSTGNVYQFGTTDCVVFKGKFYATCQDDVIEIDSISTLATPDFAWWTTTKGKAALETNYRHPLLVVEDTMLIFDKNKIHTWDGTTATAASLTLPDNANITAVEKHEDGIHVLVFTSETVNYSHTLKPLSKVYYVDTRSMQFVREVLIDDQTEGALNIGGQVFVTYGEKLGYMNGSSYEFMRKVSLPPSIAAIYKYKMANLNGVLLVVDNNAVLAYGDVSGKGKIFFYPFYNNATGNGEIRSIFPLGGNNILAAYAVSGTPKLIKLDFDNADGTTVAKTNPLIFPGRVWLREIVVDLVDPLASGSELYFYHTNTAGTDQLMMEMKYSTDGAVRQKRQRINVRTDIGSVKVNFFATPKGVRQIMLFYESAE